MKKFKKAIVALAVCAVAAVGAAGLAACSDDGITGDYHYDMTYGSTTTTYGVKVNVTVEDGVITSVTRVDSGYVEATEGYDGAWETAYNDGIDALLQTYVGKTVEYVLSIDVATAESGEPLAQGDGFVSYGDENEFLIADATQSAGRLLLAVQDALKNL